MQNSNSDLNSKIMLLEAENAALSERAEETLLFRLVAETIYQTKDSSFPIEPILEQISILKKIPFCACLEQTSNGLIVEGFYASFAELRPSEVQISFPEIDDKIPSDQGFLILEGNEFEFYGLSLRIPDQLFHPARALIIPCFSKSISTRYFFFLGNCGTENYFPKLQVLLKQIVLLAAERLENSYILGEMTRLNLELDNG
ncbi:MAG TPA: hypothetical protein VFC65_09335 [Prolixibacteraceae bacterium]|nr:hypothetical protein [Prolixibacteraceae bacterium]